MASVPVDREQMKSKPEGVREGRAERRRHARAELTPRYRRLRADIDPPPIFGELLGLLGAWLNRLAGRVRFWRYRKRRVLS